MNMSNPLVGEVMAMQDPPYAFRAGDYQSMTAFDWIIDHCDDTFVDYQFGIAPNSSRNLAFTFASTRSNFLETSDPTIRFPLTEEVFNFDKDAGLARLPTAQVLNDFSKRHLQPLGATTLPILQTKVGEFTSPQWSDYLANGHIPVGGTLTWFYYDIVGHAIGALAHPDQTFDLFRRLAELSRQIRLSDPIESKYLANGLAGTFDRQTELAKIGLLPSPATIAELFGNGRFPRDSLYELRGLVDEVAGDAPDVLDRELELNAFARHLMQIYSDSPRICSWIRWEALTVDHHYQQIVEKLREAPSLVIN